MLIPCPSCFTENPPENLICQDCGTPLVIDTVTYHLPAGSNLTSPKSTYIIDKVLGIGGFGITYKARDVHNNNRPVAIKENWPESAIRQGKTVIWPSSIAPKDRKIQVEKVIQEAENIALCHKPQPQPHIVQVYDWFTANNTAYIVMELLVGKSLGDYLKNHGTMSEVKLKKYAQQIAKALQKIHEKQLLHRDIKPDNLILLEAEERVVLIDFGNAREYIANQTQKMTQILTPGYAPLEQYAQTSKRSPTIDIYALCATLYELATNQMPLAAPERVAAAGDGLIAPRQLNPHLSQEIERVILTGMQIKAENRYQNAQDFLLALEGYPPGILLARQLVQQGQLKKAVAAYDKSLQNFAHPTTTVELALVLTHVNPERAQEIALRAIKIAPQDARGYAVLGLLACYRAAWPEAQDYLEKALQIEPNLGWARANLAWALAELQQWTQARLAAQKASQLNPNCAFSLGLQAWIAWHEKRYKDTIRFASPILYHQENRQILYWLYPCVILALEQALVNKKAPDLKLRLEKFSQEVPEHGFPLGYQGWHNAQQSLWDQALQDFQQASQKDVVPPWVILNQAITLEHLGQIAQAIDIYKTYGELDGFVCYRLGVLYGKCQKWEEAKIYLEKAVQLEPQSAQAYHNLAWVLLNSQTANPYQILGYYRQAISLYRQFYLSQYAETLENSLKNCQLATF